MMDFAEAFRLLKDGHRLRRPGFDFEYLFFQDGVLRLAYSPTHHSLPGLVNEWQPRPEDLYAEDWAVLGEPPSASAGPPVNEPPLPDASSVGVGISLPPEDDVGEAEASTPEESASEVLG